MPYKKGTCDIPLCKTCAKGYVTKKDGNIVIVDSSKKCLGHYTDLDTITCIKKGKRQNGEK